MKLGACSVALLCFALAPVAHASVVEYLHIEANVGGSTGGHAAVHFADAGLVFDYQNDELDNLRLRRLYYQHFRYLYSVRGNRTIHVARVEVPPATHDALLSRFNRALLIQDKHYRVLESLHRDRELARFLSERDPEAPPRGDPGPRLRLRGSGFFFEGRESGIAGTSEPLDALRSEVAARHGDDFLAARIEALTREVSEIDLLATSPQPRISKTGLPHSGYLPSERFVDLSLQILALRALAEARPVRTEAVRRGESSDLALDAEERQRITVFADELETRLVDLTHSGRPDWGFALLLGMARLEVLRESAASGRLVLLDAIPNHAVPLTPTEVDRTRTYLEEMGAWSRDRFLEERSAFFAHAAPSEAALARLEATASRYLEIHEGLSLGRELRLHAGDLAPDRATRVEVPLPEMTASGLHAARAQSEAHLRSYEGELEDTLGYHLTTHNCVTELFAMLNANSGEAGALTRPGEDLPEPGLLGTIPFVSHARFVEATDPTLVGEIPSYRRVRLEEMYGEENDVLVYLREANTLTSTVYRRDSDDSFFLFFTDDAPLLRPLYGAFNLAAGLGEMLLGVVASPFDGGRMLWSGAKGAVFSLPELAFVNIRKGRLAYAPSDPPRTAVRP